MLTAWAEVEASIDSVLLAEYDLYDKPDVDAKVEFVLSQSFRAKLDLLKKLGKIGNKDYKTIDDFRKARNYIFHGRPFEPWSTQISVEARKRYMAVGWKGVQATREVTVSTFRKRLEELNLLSPWELE